MAHVTIHGTLASDPKILSTGGFREIVLLRVVETLEWYDGEGSRHTGESEHHAVIVSGADAENSMSLRKGALHNAGCSRGLNPPASRSALAM